MRHTLRRSCASCATSKHGCDLRMPRCSRCAKRGVECIYANEPLTTPLASGGKDAGTLVPLEEYQPLSDHSLVSLDPFDSYPQTRLPRKYTQRLIHTFLHKIAFQYYPLDVSPTSNPFLMSWWPLALGDPALFHVSLQTACLDEELLAQKGFHNSFILMADSVSLLRRKIENTSLAMQDGTINSVITLATIEFGKGNIEVSEMHVEGVKQLVHLRGGISSVRQTSPLTARMVSWVSMLIMGHPQFQTQDDDGIGDGLPPIPEWQLDSTGTDCQDRELFGLEVDYAVTNVLIRLRSIFRRAQRVPLPTTRLHDLTCFAIHRLLNSTPKDEIALFPMTECIRYTIILYMFIAHGPTYYSHVVIQNSILVHLMEYIEQAQPDFLVHGSLDVWFVAVGMAASTGTPHYTWFAERARIIAALLEVPSSTEALSRMQSILWLDTPQGETIFRPHWDVILDPPAHSSDLALKTAVP